MFRELEFPGFQDLPEVNQIVFALPHKSNETLQQADELSFVHDVEMGGQEHQQCLHCLWVIYFVFLHGLQHEEQLFRTEVLEGLLVVFLVE